jgi:hypothetical protein
MSSDYTRTYVNPKDEDVPGFSVFSRRDGTVRHFYSGEMSAAMADPGQDPRGAQTRTLFGRWWISRRKVAAPTGTRSSTIKNRTRNKEGHMCPACIASTAVMVAGAGSTGGILALCIGKFRSFFRVSSLSLFQRGKEK